MSAKFSMKRISRAMWIANAARRGALVICCLAFSAAIGYAGTVSGVVRNGTTDKPGSGVDVVLIQLQSGMNVVANTKTDSQGRYHLDFPDIGAAPMLIRAIYHGVNYHQPVPPGPSTATADVTIYEPTTNPLAMQVTTHFIAFQPNGDKLDIGEEYSIQNEVKPPSAYFNPQGNFEFSLPTGAEIGSVAATGPSGMPVVQGTINKGNNKYAIAYAFQPGQNNVRLSYELPYAGNRATLHLLSAYDAQHVLLLVPPTMQVTSSGFNAAGSEQGYNVYQRDQMPAETSFDVSVSGTAPPPQDSSAQGQSQPADQVNGRDAGSALEALPARLDSEVWILIVGLGALFGLGVAILLKRSAPVVAAAGGAAAVAAPPPALKSNRKLRAATPPAAAPAAPSAAEVQREVGVSLDALKDTLLRLELRRQAGTISEADYLRERTRTEEILRSLVQG